MIAAKHPAGHVVQMHQAFSGWIWKSAYHLPWRFLFHTTKLRSAARGGKFEMQPREDNPDKISVRASSGLLDLEVPQ